MSVRILIAAAALLAVAAPAVAQDAPAAPAQSAPAQAAPAQAPSAEAAALEAKGEAFEARIEAMRGEMQAAVTAAGGDQGKLTADLDAIVAKYQPEADAFATELEAFFANPPAEVPAEQRAGMSQAGPMVGAQIRGFPAQAKAETLAQAAPAAPAAPATPR